MRDSGLKVWVLETEGNKWRIFFIRPMARNKQRICFHANEIRWKSLPFNPCEQIRTDLVLTMVASLISIKSAFIHTI